jgi:ABC-type multidrug transport system fused ATPase/permease subunit
MSQSVQAWRGIASDEEEERTAGVAALLRRASRELLASLLRPYRARLALASFLIVTQTAAVLAIPYLIGLAIDRGIQPLAHGAASQTALLGFAGGILAMTLISFAAENAFLRVSGDVGQDILLDLRTRLFQHFQDLSLGFYEQFTSGRIIARLTSDVEAISELLQTGMSSLVTSLLKVVVIGILMLILDVRLGMVAMAAFPLIIVLSRWFRQHSERAYRDVRTAIALVIIHFTESLRGISAVHAFRREPRNQEIFEGVNAQYRDANIWSGQLAATFGPAIDLVGRFTTAIVLAFGAWLVLHHSVTFGVLTASVLYVRQFFEPMQDLSQFYNVFQAAAAALDKLGSVFAESPAVPEPQSPVALPAQGARLAFENVTFGYREEPVLHQIDVEIPTGQTVALVGQTGAGKSTLARLMCRFYDPTAGRVTLNGIDLRAIAGHELHAAVVAVTQESFLFSGSVAANISFGRPAATRSEIETAAAAVGADTFIRALPDGYDTDVKKRGGRLSAGQRQLVAFARAFLANPRVLILDEATSSLDLPTERLVQRALRTLLTDRTAVIIAHRLSTVEIADRVIVIDRGRIIEDGSPQELLRGEGQYRALHRAWLESLS